MESLKRVHKVVLFLFLGILSFPTLLGQKNMDFQSRANFEVSMDLNKDLGVSLEFGQRFKDNSLRYDRSLLTAGIKYDLPKGFAIAAGARYLLVQNSSNILESRYRFHGDLSYGWNISDLKIKLRERAQYGFDDIISYENFGNKLTSRSRVRLEYDVFGTPVSLYSSFEIYMVLNDPTSSPYSLNKVVAGMSYNLPKDLELKLYYLLEDEVNTAYPDQAHIVVVALGLKL